MRSLLLVAAMISPAHALDTLVGWCPPTTIPARLIATKSFEIRADTFAVKPMRTRGFDSRQIAHPRFDQPHNAYVAVTTELAKGKLQFVTPEVWCMDRRVSSIDPCYGQPNHIVSPRKVLFADPIAVPAGVCVGFVVKVADTAFVVGLDREMRVYAIDTGDKIRALKTIKTPRLEVLERAPAGGPLVLQEANGPVWLARWDGKDVSLSQVTGIAGRVISLAMSNGTEPYAFTDQALYKLDPKTYAVQWKLDGEFWGFMPQDVPRRLFVLAVDRSKPKPRVLLKLVDDNGKVLRETKVYEGPVKHTELDFVFNGIYVVHVAA